MRPQICWNIGVSSRHEFTYPDIPEEWIEMLQKMRKRTITRLKEATGYKISSDACMK